jgi:peptide/nickel transport system ATP-binding protein
VPSRGKDLLAFRRQAQIIFQDPYQSLNPRFTIFDIVSEPLIIHGLARKRDMRERVIETLDQVGLRPPASFLHRFPHELSGGQRQRVAIARAVVLRPRLIVADEPVSMLDVSVRAGILRLLRSFSRDSGLSVIYISHDISTVRYLCDRTAVMYLGRIVEIGPTSSVLDAPMHPYTSALLAAVPRIGGGAAARSRVTLVGDVPGSMRPSGCVFHPRCPKVFEPCANVLPRQIPLSDVHEVACHLYTYDRRSPTAATNRQTLTAPQL